MKIICAGSIKTGTKSLHEALAILGYKVYDFQDHFYYLHDDWFKVFKGKATVEDFRRMYKDIDAGVDVPFNHYSREMLEAFPDAKIILTVRESEEAWIESVVRQIEAIKNNTMVSLMMHFSPLGWKWLSFFDCIARIIYGSKLYRVWHKGINENLYLKHYKMQKAYVTHCAPKDQLLVFNCKEGWKPLCKFLDVPVPENIPFPHKNAKGDVFDELVSKHPAFIELQRQTKISISVVVLFVAVIAFVCSVLINKT